MATATATEPMYPALAAPPPPSRPKVALVGAMLGAAGMVLAYAGLLGTYLAQRASTPAPWLPDTVTIPLAPPTMAAATLILSVGFVHWAHVAIRDDDRTNAYVALGLAIVMGLAYINSAVYLFTQMGATIGGTVTELLLFAVGGFHIATVALGIVVVALTALRALGGQFSSRDNEGLAAAALVWDVAVVLYLVSWYAVYITK